MKIIAKSIDINAELNTLPFSQLVKKVLTMRNLSADEISALLMEPKLSNPFDADGIEECVRILKTVKEKNEKILVCGDYDADGICATAILVNALNKAGISNGFYIPDRLSEGYGLNAKTVKMALSKGYRYFITVDNGVKAFEAMKLIHDANAVLIITDHHNYDESELLCDCFVHPFKMQKQFQCLSGAGVAALIARALTGESKETIILAAVAAIADCMPMIDENRSIVKLGLRYLNQGYCEPILSLKNNPYEKCDETTIGFQIAPKLNGTGRMADLAKANNTVRYLLCNDSEMIKTMAQQINQINEVRKKVTAEMVEKAKLSLDETSRFDVIADSDFHEGIVGLVAGKLSSELMKPIMVLSKKDHIYRGSIRSIEGFDLRNFFDEIKTKLLNYGGHELAAGISFDEKYYDEILSYIHQASEKIELLEPVIEGIAVDETELSLDAVESLNVIKPFGMAFEEPVFVTEFEIDEMKLMGKNQHLKLISKQKIEYVCFGMGNLYDKLETGNRLKVCGTLSVNQFRNQKKVNFMVRDVEVFDALGY